MYGLEREKNVEKKTREVTENPKKEWPVLVDIFLFGYERGKKLLQDHVILTRQQLLEIMSDMQQKKLKS
jgi:hypothetical protein